MVAAGGAWRVTGGVTSRVGAGAPGSSLYRASRDESGTGMSDVTRIHGSTRTSAKTANAAITLLLLDRANPPGDRTRAFPGDGPNRPSQHQVCSSRMT